jgi:hypothetical protein
VRIRLDAHIRTIVVLTGDKLTGIYFLHLISIIYFSIYDELVDAYSSLNRCPIYDEPVDCHCRPVHRTHEPIPCFFTVKIIHNS